MKLTTIKPGKGYPDNLATVYVQGRPGIEAFIAQSGRTEGGKTVAQVRAENPGKTVLVIALGDAMERIAAVQNEAFITPWSEIDEERYDDMLNVLPPENWQSVDGVQIFRMCEYYTSNITSHFAKIGSRYFAGRFRTSGPTYAEHAATIHDLVA